MSWAVVIDAGLFDNIIYESPSKNAAEIYYIQTKNLASVPIELKPSEKVRKLREVFATTEILVSLSV